MRDEGQPLEVQEFPWEISLAGVKLRENIGLLRMGLAEFAQRLKTLEAKVAEGGNTPSASPNAEVEALRKEVAKLVEANAKLEAQVKALEGKAEPKPSTRRTPKKETE